MVSDPVKRKVALLEDILALTRKMEEVAGSGTLETMLALLAERGHLMDEVKACDEHIDPAKLSPEDRERILSLLHQIAVLSEKVNLQVLASVAQEKEALLRLREGRAFLERVRESFPQGLGDVDVTG